jgi:hypothetical protein
VLNSTEAEQNEREESKNSHQSGRQIPTTSYLLRQERYVDGARIAREQDRRSERMQNLNSVEASRRRKRLQWT